MKKIFIHTCIGVITLLSLVGCGKREVAESESTLAPDVGYTVTDMESLEDDSYFVYRDGTYYQLYVGNANYTVSSSSNPDVKKTLWFMEDFEKIPTMYKGDMLVFKTSKPLTEKIYIERFEYAGYTIGISGLKKTDSGRYSLNLETTAKTINPKSDAMQLADLEANVVIIDRFGGSYLRSGNVSGGGCILGLSKGKVYAADVYVGTYLHDMRFTADTIALTSMEAEISVDYDFLQSQLISIKIPEFYNSGYYLINGYGVVRYVNGTSYNEDTDFNIPNISPEEKSSSAEEGTEKNNRWYYDETAVLNIDRSSEYLIRISCYNDNQKIQPGAVLYNGERAYQFKREKEENVLELTAELEEGNYTVSMSGLNGGYYQVDIEDVRVETEEESEELTTDE